MAFKISEKSSSSILKIAHDINSNLTGLDYLNQGIK